MLAQRVAHRGYGERENTIAAFARAVGQGCEWVELDVRTTVDGIPIVVHDETLERLWGLDRRVDEVEWGQAAGLGSGVNVIPRLRDVLDWANGAAISLMIDVNTERDATAAHSEVRQTRVGVPIGWCGPLPATKVIRAADPTAIVQFNHPGGDLDLVGLVGLHPQAVNAEWKQYSDALIEQIHAFGLRAWAWTANEVHAMEYLLELGVDAITTDDLPMLNRVLDGHKRNPF